MVLSVSVFGGVAIVIGAVAVDVVVAFITVGVVVVIVLGFWCCLHFCSLLLLSMCV